jgi:hypothetical protein
MRHTSLQIAQRIAHQTGRLAALAVFALALTGCQIVAGTTLYTQVRFIDASPDAPGLDVYQNSTATLYNIGLGTASSYVAIAPGSYTYSVDVTATRQQLADVAGPFALGVQYTVLIGHITAKLQMTILKDQSTPAPSGQVALRFLDQSTRNGPVDIYLLTPGAALTGVSPIVKDIAFGNTPAYIDAPIGTYSIVIVPTGTVPTSATVPLYAGSEIDYASAAARTIVLIDQQLVTTPVLQVISADDYDSPASTT